MYLLASIENDVELYALDFCTEKRLFLKEDRFCLLFLSSESEHYLAEPIGSIDVTKLKTAPLYQNNLIWFSSVKEEKYIRLTSKTKLKGYFLVFSNSMTFLASQANVLISVLLSIYSESKFIYNSSHYSIPISDFDAVKQEFEQLSYQLGFHAKDSKEPWRRLAFATKMINIVLYIHLWNGYEKKTTKELHTFEYYGLANTFCHLMEQYYHTDKKIDFYLEKLGLDDIRALNTATKLVFGETSKQLLIDKKVSEAQKRLTLSDLTIKDIGYEIGFLEPTNFNKFFLKYVGMTPVDYRKQFGVAFNSPSDEDNPVA